MMEQKVWHGSGCLSQLAEILIELRIRRPMLVAGSHLAAYFGLAEAVRFSGYHPNPDFADCVAGAALFRSSGCDGLIAMGGGSAIDTAKGIKAVLLAASPEDAMAGRMGEGYVPLVAVPGTAGTGSEATQIGVAYVDGRKISFGGEALLPEAALLDPDLLVTLPELHKKSCALDALCQGIESWWSVASSPESRIHAERAFLGVLRNITPYLEGDASAAEAVMLAAYESGKAIRLTRTTAAHAMSYMITKRVGYPHGQACALTLPVLWERMLHDPALAPRMADLASLLGLSSAAEGPCLFHGLMAATGMEAAKLPEEDTLQFLAASVDPERLGNHPQMLTKDDLLSIYRTAFTPLEGSERADCQRLWSEWSAAQSA